MAGHSLHSSDRAAYQHVTPISLEVTVWSDGLTPTQSWMMASLYYSNTGRGTIGATLYANDDNITTCAAHRRRMELGTTTAPAWPT